MSLLLVRHAETALNAARVLQPADTPLGERGRAQALALARRLADDGVAGIVASDLPRAAETAAAVAAATGLGVAYDKRLRERDFGHWRGLAYDSFGFDALAVADAPPGGESLAAFHERVDDAFADLVARRAALPGALVVVTHGLVVRALLRHCAVAPGAWPRHLANTAVSVVGARAPHAALLVGCTRHLGAPADPRALDGG